MHSNPSTSAPASTGYAIYVLGLLWLAYILSFIDRQVLALLVGPIREDFAISDTQFSLLHGLAFALFYTLLGLPIGRLADRSNRRNIIVAGVALWSLMTCLCGAAKNFTSLFLARIGVGVGEAALSPPAHSLLSDYFRPEKLPAVFSFYSSGIILGSGFAYILGGKIYNYFDAIEQLRFPLVGAINAWQATFIAVGLPGLLIALLMLTIREPARTGQQQSTETPQALPLGEVLAYIHQRRRVYYSMIVGISLLSILGYATMAWYPEFLQRSYGMSRGDAGAQFGQLFIAAGLLGTLLLAWSTQAMGKRGILDADYRIVLFVACAELIPAAVAPLMPSANSALAVVSILVALQYGYFGIAIAALQRITPNELRAQVSAVLLFMTNMLGLIVGPTVVAVLTDYVYKDESALYLSLSTTAVVFLPMAIVVLWYGKKGYARLVEEAEARSLAGQ